MARALPDLKALVTRATNPPVASPKRRRWLPWTAALLTLGGVCLAVAVLATCHRLPIWSGVIEVTPIERPALEACGKGQLTTPGSDNLMRAPYLQHVGRDHATLVFAAPPNPAYLVQVRTPRGDMATTSRARFADDPGREATIRQRLPALGSKESVDAEDYYVQRVDLRGLEPNTLYCYQLMGPGGA